MKKSLQQRPHERLHEWMARLATELQMTDEQYDALCEIAWQAYITGSDTAFEIFNKHNK